MRSRRRNPVRQPDLDSRNAVCSGAAPMRFMASSSSTPADAWQLAYIGEIKGAGKQAFGGRELPVQGRGRAHRSAVPDHDRRRAARALARVRHAGERAALRPLRRRAWKHPAAAYARGQVRAAGFARRAHEEDARLQRAAAAMPAGVRREGPPLRRRALGWHLDHAAALSGAPGTSSGGTPISAPGPAWRAATTSASIRLTTRSMATMRGVELGSVTATFFAWMVAVIVGGVPLAFRPIRASRSRL